MTGSITRVNPRQCRFFFCDSSPYSVKSHGLCPKHYQRYRRHNGKALDADTEALLNWLYSNLLPHIDTVLFSDEKAFYSEQGKLEVLSAWKQIEIAMKQLDEISELVSEGE